LVGSEESQLAGNEEAVVRRRWGEVERERVGVAASEQWKKGKRRASKSPRGTKACLLETLENLPVPGSASRRSISSACGPDRCLGSAA
jgi:hypothetical protein